MSIAQSHSVMRWVPKTKLRHDPDTLEPIGPLPVAFRLRIEQRPPEAYLSASWVEHVEAGPDEQVRITATALAQQVHTTPAKGGAFAVGRVGEIKAACKANGGPEPRIVSAPTKRFPAYAQVWGIDADALAVHTALAYGAWSRVVKAADVLAPTSAPEEP